MPSGFQSVSTAGVSYAFTAANTRLITTSLVVNVWVPVAIAAIAGVYAALAKLSGILQAHDHAQSREPDRSAEGPASGFIIRAVPHCRSFS